MKAKLAPKPLSIPTEEVLLEVGRKRLIKDGLLKEYWYYDGMNYHGPYGSLILCLGLCPILKTEARPPRILRCRCGSYNVGVGANPTYRCLSCLAVWDY